jgi:hypothetical protein
MIAEGASFGREGARVRSSVPRGECWIAGVQALEFVEMRGRDGGLLCHGGGSFHEGNAIIDSMTNRGARARSAYAHEGSTIDVEKATACTGKQARIAYIADLMASGRFVTRRTVSELATVWRLRKRTVQGEYVTSAAAVCRASLGSAEEIRTTALCTVESIRARCTAIAQNALERGKEHVAARFFEVSLQATSGLLAFASRDFDERIALSKDGRAAEKHKRKMGDGTVKNVILRVEEAHAPMERLGALLAQRFKDRPDVMAEILAATDEMEREGEAAIDAASREAIMRVHLKRGPVDADGAPLS